MFGEYPDSEDMSAVANKLKSLGVEHRFILSGARQQLVLLRDEDCEIVANIIQQWRQGDLDNQLEEIKKSSIRIAHKPAPLTLFLVFLGFIGTALTAFGWEFIHPFTFWHSLRAEHLLFVDFNPWLDIKNGQLWRLITPVFLHFGPVHIIFNALWIWYLGTILELNQGRLITLILVLTIGVASNSAQAFVSEGIVFGGLSGVVYGLFAYCWLWGKMHKGSRVQLPDILFIVMTVLMLLSPLGIFDIIVGSEIADTAHISGYVTGLLCALAGSLLIKAGTKWN